MRSLFTILLLNILTIGLHAQDDAISQFFSKYQEDDAFSSIYISPRMFQMFANVEDENGEVNEEVQNVLNNIQGLRILSTDQNGSSLFKESKAKLLDNSYELLMNVKEDDNDVEFMIKEGKDGKIKELLLLVGGEQGFTMLSFVGNLLLSDLSALASKMDIDGLEYLDQLEDK